VKIKGLGGSGTLAGVASLASTNFDTFGSYCAVLTPGGRTAGGTGMTVSSETGCAAARTAAANRGHAFGVVPLLAAAEELPLRAASLDVVTASSCVHHFNLGRFLAAAAWVLRPRGQLFIYTRTPQQNARTIWGRYFPGFTEHEHRLHSQAAIRDAAGEPAGSRWSLHRPSSTRAQAQLRGSGPGRGAPLLDILLLDAGGAARSHGDLPGPPARPRRLLG
jgi:SAM-dependent methyltransferase